MTRSPSAKRISARSLALVFSVLVAGLARAGTLSDAAPGPTPAPGPVVDTAFQRGAHELQIESGFSLSLQSTALRVTNFDYELTVIRVGYMLDTPHGSNFLRGNNEFMIETEGGPIFHGYGSALGGVSLIYRRNFLSPGARVVPYLNLGVGGIYSDAYHDKVQRQLGGRFEFDLQVSAGMRVRISPHWSLDAEFAYRHFSDAFITSRNLGTNGVGGVFGVSRSF